MKTIAVTIDDATLKLLDEFDRGRAQAPITLGACPDRAP
jgi:hypothetical protein